MKEIPTARGLVIKVDDSDYEELSKHCWSIWKADNRGHFYAGRYQRLPSGKKRVIYMHRFLLGIVDGPRHRMADHKDGNGLNNQRSNLRIVGPSGNGANRKLSKNNTSGIKGVWRNKATKKWQASVRFYGKAVHLGMFDRIEDAAKAYRDAAVELWGECANPTGFPMQCTCPQCNYPKTT